jgi:hypothetical protein
MRKTMAIVSSASLVLSGLALFGIASAASPSLAVNPWVYDPASACPGVASTINPDGSLTLSKPCATSTNASAGATIQGVSGMSTTGMTLSFDVNGYCGAGAPRFNVYLSDGSTIFLGCIYGNDGTGHVTFTAGNTYGGVLFPTGATVTGIDLVQDETGTTTLSNIQVNGTPVAVSNQALKDMCKKGGWQSMFDLQGNSFKNQGQCVSYFEKLSH